ncbi:MAG TPA: signal peptide peptidase SppA [Tepidisphaeraceae bacterium]|nr:signal peptide peptidase SppA [Tepidisphaeraceae bacterium]
MIRFFPALLVSCLTVAVVAAEVDHKKAKPAATTAPVAQVVTKLDAPPKPAPEKGAPEKPVPVPNKPEKAPDKPKPVPPIVPKPDPAKPATPAATGDEAFPTPAELMKRIKEKQAALDKQPKVAHISLSLPIVEKSPEFTLFGDSHLLTIPGLLDRLHKARDDKGLRGVLLTLSAQTELNTAQALEIKGALDELRKAGKKTYVYADSFTTPTYLAASGATDICLLSGGDLMFQGVAIEPMFFKGLFDKLGVKAEMIQIGEFKGADEQYTRVELSPESRGELDRLADGIYNLVVDRIAQSRNIKPTVVKQIIDDVFVSAKAAKDKGLVDHLIAQEELREFLQKELGAEEINLVDNYAVPKVEKFDFSNPMAALMQLGNKKKSADDDKPKVALIHAEGEIVDGETEDGILGPSSSIGGENIRQAFRLALRDDNVKAIVLRIDSPGGSAAASEVMWQAANAAAQQKPVIVSVGSMAASGGYYLASAGDHIFADPSAIVGSIGVVGGKFVLHGLFEKLGITTETITRGKNADMWSMDKEWNDRQKRMVTNWMKATYEQFTDRIMTNRGKKIKDIDKAARGRIFLAKEAKELGLVDEIGGLTAAIKHAAGEVDLEEGKYEIKFVPGSKSLIDLLTGNVDPATTEAGLPIRPTIKIGSDSPLALLPAPVRAKLQQQIRLVQMMDRRPVLLVSPYTISVK